MTLSDTVLQKMIAFDRGDARRIQHFLKVYAFATEIGRMEQLPDDVQQTLELAGILHDIGIHASEEKYGSTAGKYQEQEGPAPARTLLASCECATGVIDRVCFLIAHHHTYTGVDGIDWQILLEADFLVNAYEDNLSKDAIASFREKVFCTPSGKTLLDTMFGLSAE